MTNEDWGWWKLVEKNPLYMVKILLIESGYSSPKHYHKYKIETIIVMRGSLEVQTRNESVVLHENDTLTIDSNMIHQITALEDCYYTECATPFDEMIILDEDI